MNYLDINVASRAARAAIAAGGIADLSFSDCSEQTPNNPNNSADDPSLTPNYFQNMNLSQI